MEFPKDAFKRMNQFHPMNHSKKKRPFVIKEGTKVRVNQEGHYRDRQVGLVISRLKPRTVYSDYYRVSFQSPQVVVKFYEHGDLSICEVIDDILLTRTTKPLPF